MPLPSSTREARLKRGVTTINPFFGTTRNPAARTRGLLGALPTFDHVGFLTRTVEDGEIMCHAALDVRRATTPAAALPTPGVRIGVARNYFFEALGPSRRH